MRRKPELPLGFLFPTLTTDIQISSQAEECSIHRVQIASWFRICTELSQVLIESPFHADVFRSEFRSPDIGCDRSKLWPYRVSVRMNPEGYIGKILAALEIRI